MNYIRMPSNEFVAKIIAGETDFSRVKLAERADLTAHGDYARMNDALRTQAEGGSTLLLDGSLFRYVKMGGIHLPFAKASGAEFHDCDLTRADLRAGWFDTSSFDHSCLNEADLRDTKLQRADFTGASLRGANLGNAKVYGTVLKEADLRGAQGLRSAQDLGYAVFDDTIVTRNEARILTGVLGKRTDYFDKRTE